jgi:hypothetical protein
MKKKIIVSIIVILLLACGGFFWWGSQEEEEEPKTYSEVFEEPIDPNLEPERHKEVYKKVQEIVHFPVLYPETMPEGWELKEVESTEGEKLENGKYYGANIITYKKENKKLEILEGLIDIGTVKDLKESVDLWGGYKGAFWQGGLQNEEFLGMTIFKEVTSVEDYGYFLIGYNVSKEELIKIANLLIEMK